MATIIHAGRTKTTRRLWKESDNRRENMMPSFAKMTTLLRQNNASRKLSNVELNVQLQERPNWPNFVKRSLKRSF